MSLRLERADPKAHLIEAVPFIVFILLQEALEKASNSLVQHMDGPIEANGFSF